MFFMFHSNGKAIDVSKAITKNVIRFASKCVSPWTIAVIISSSSILTWTRDTTTSVGAGPVGSKCDGRHRRSRCREAEQGPVPLGWGEALFQLRWLEE
jgi:hypothetical protein